MNKHTRFALLGLGLAIFLLVSCDWKRLTGTNINGEIPDDVVIVSGSIKHFYTNRPVINANVRIGDYNKFSDFTGQFQINYKLTGSESRNKPTLMSVSQQGYETFFDTLYIGTTDLKIEIKLVYVYPLLDNLTKESDGIISIQVTDYQGLSDIKSVLGKFAIEDTSEDFIMRTYFVPFAISRQISSVSAIYEVSFSPEWIPTYQKSKNRLTIIAEDYENHVDSVSMLMGNIF